MLHTWKIILSDRTLASTSFLSELASAFSKCATPPLEADTVVFDASSTANPVVPFDDGNHTLFVLISKAS